MSGGNLGHLTTVLVVLAFQTVSNAIFTATKTQLPSIGQFIALFYAFILKLMLAAMVAEIIGWNYTGQEFILNNNKLLDNNHVSIAKNPLNRSRVFVPKNVQKFTLNPNDLRDLDSALLKLASLSQSTEGRASSNSFLKTIGSILDVIFSFETEECLTRMICTFAAGSNPNEKKFAHNVSVMAVRLSARIPRIRKYATAVNLGVGSGSLFVCKLAYPSCTERIELISQAVLAIV